MMTRKDYVATAEILSDWADVMDYETLHALARDFANYFESDNYRFNREIFYKAAGLK